MQERIYEILTFLLKRILSKENQTMNHKLITHDLLDKGFEIGEIQEAFEILASTKHLDIEEENLPCESFRMFNDYEKFRFSIDAQGALILLEQFGIVTPYQLEEIIDTALSINLPEITKREVAFVAMQVIAESAGIIVAKDVWNFFEEDSEGVEEI